MSQHISASLKGARQYFIDTGTLNIDTLLVYKLSYILSLLFLQILSETFNTGIIKSVALQSVVAVLVSTAGQEVGKTKMKASEKQITKVPSVF